VKQLKPHWKGIALREAELDEFLGLVDTLKNEGRELVPAATSFSVDEDDDTTPKRGKQLTKRGGGGEGESRAKK
jgi:cytochrome oxidase Cu insertion factor (SCO1/SenC/PrrC family)